MNLKNQLRLYLDRRHLTATQLSKASGVSKQVISLWLSNGKPRNLDQVKNVANALGVTVDHLCYGKGPSSTDSASNDLEKLFFNDDWVTGSFEIKIRRIKK